MGFNLENLSEKEQELYIMIKQLHKREQNQLLEMIKNTDIDEVSICNEINSAVRILEDRGLIQVVPKYHGRGYGFFVLPDSPNLREELAAKGIEGNWKRLIKKVFPQRA